MSMKVAVCVVNVIRIIHKKSTAMEQNKQLSLQFASISGRKVIADFTGGDVTSDVGVLVMRETANKIGIIEQLTQAIHDERHQVM